MTFLSGAESVLDMPAVNCPDGGPPRNLDVSGIGVRISFYLQSLSLGLLCIRSTSPSEITGTMYNLLMSNTAIAIAGLILGIKSEPDISLQDSIIILYLLGLSWMMVFLSLPVLNRLPGGRNLLNLFAIGQSYIIFAFAFTILIRGQSFGSHPECNQKAQVVLFRPFNFFQAGRILALICIGTVCLAYTGMVYKDYAHPVVKEVPKRAKELWSKNIRKRQLNLPEDTKEDGSNEVEHPEINMQPRTMTYITRQGTQRERIHYVSYSGALVLMVLLLIVLWTIAVINTELLIKWNGTNPSGGSDSIAEFGQLLPLFLIIVPLASSLSAFKKHGLRPRPFSA